MTDTGPSVSELLAEIEQLRSSRNLNVASAADTHTTAYSVATEDTNQTVTDNNGNISHVHPLDAIAAKHGTDSKILYALNRVALEGNAAARGFTDSDGGRIVFPGTVLKVPV